MKKIFDKDKLYFFIRKPRFALVISLCIVIVGLISLAGLKQESYPDVTPPQIRVSANYMGASAEVIESSIATVLENKLNGVENMTYMTSTSSDGSYSLTMYFKVGSDKNINLMNVNNRIQQVQSQLPEDVQRTGVTAVSRSSGSGALMFALVPESGNWSRLDLSNYASIYIKDELKRVEGVADVDVYGAGDYSMRIWLDPQKMAGLNISSSDVRSAISNQNTQVTAGSLGALPTDDAQALQLTLKTKGRLSDVKEFENIILRSNMDGSNVRIKDIGRVELGAQDYSRLGLIDGKPATIIAVSQLPDANIINMSKAVHAKVDELNARFTNGLKIMTIKDDADYIHESMKEVEFTILLTGLIVVLIIFLFLGDGMATLVPCVTIPVSLLGTFVALKALNMSINMLSLFALVLAILAPLSAATDGKYTIAFSLKTTTNDDFQKAIADSVESHVKAAGHNFMLVTAGEQTAVSTQVNQIEDLINRKVDGLVVNPMDANAVVPALTKAKEAGIPVVLVDCAIADGNEDLSVTYTGTDNYNTGKVAGETLAAALGGEGNVLIVRGANGNAAGEDRVAGFKAGLEGTNV